MAFGQPSGPPATARQLQELLDLVHAAGHVDLRDARGPLGLTQRQAGGKFTRDEADAFIARLGDENAALADVGDPTPGIPASPARPKSAVGERDRQLEKVPSASLAAELQRRGWIVMEP